MQQAYPGQQQSWSGPTTSQSNPQMTMVQAAPSQQQQQPQPMASQPQPMKPSHAKRPRRRVLTSLTLEVFTYFGGCWDIFYYILNILVFVYKGLQFPYPGTNFAMEFCFAWLWPFIEIPRLYLSSKGNKTEQQAPLFFSIVLALPLLAMYVYYVAFQTYVLKIDLFLNGVAIAFLALQIIFGLISAIRFMMATKFA